MFPLEIFHVSLMRDLRLRTWTDEAAFADLLSASKARVTSDGHFVLRFESATSPLRVKAFEAIRKAEEFGLELSGGCGMNVSYRGELYPADLAHFEPANCYTTYRHPDVSGNFLDQPPGFVTITVVSNKRTLKSLLDRWKSRFSHPSGGEKSRFFTATSGAALQIRLSCDEVSLEDVIDVVVAGSFDIRKRRKNKLIHGLSSTMMGLPKKWVQITKVEDEYGPFERI